MRFPWKRTETDLERELAHHLHELTLEYERQGHSHEEALRMAKREFGGSEQVKEQCRDERRWAWMQGLRQDVVFGVRMMRKTPVITLAAVLSLGLGIGANTAIVSLMDLVLWRDLPVPNARQLDLVDWQGHGFHERFWTAHRAACRGTVAGMLPTFFPIRVFERYARVLPAGLAGCFFVSRTTVSISFAGRPRVGQERPVSGNFFSTLQVHARLGRLFSDNDDNESAPATVVLSHRFWVNALGSDPGVSARP